MLDGALYAVTDEQERRLLALDAAGVRSFAETVEEAPPHLYPMTAGLGTAWEPLQRCLGGRFPLSHAVLGGRALCDGEVVVRHVTAAQAQAVALALGRLDEGWLRQRHATAVGGDPQAALAAFRHLRSFYTGAAKAARAVVFTAV
ncbi:DUF1877 family protein [Dactylosporangium aurantiacum]|uniref:DUF1877 family protein n=1 Tax=Dactylosporangium aurantiacum TaxID=35754 RepID=A0A9Q9MAC2_9ACTN|nr:DUF1877 family protein [Dactylosporangium aurantiacum]MDG6105161.1 DUF1877 family protein [Dactylosporangium aurantiacum]UWZ51683.1 DUF1877 family protein [Dactylosporangium aurantiacum]